MYGWSFDRINARCCRDLSATGLNILLISCVLNADSDRYADALITYTRGASASAVPVTLYMSSIAKFLILRFCIVLLLRQLWRLQEVWHFLPCLEYCAAYTLRETVSDIYILLSADCMSSLWIMWPVMRETETALHNNYIYFLIFLSD